jgi:cellulose biosynthesis protein BcsQ
MARAQGSGNPPTRRCPLHAVGGWSGNLSRSRCCLLFHRYRSHDLGSECLADLVLIPVRPSPADLWAVSETVAQVQSVGKPFLFVITQAKPQASITAQSIAALSQYGRVAQSFIGDRVPSATAMTGGQTAPELAAKSPAAKEIATLWIEVKSCFNENSK